MGYLVWECDTEGGFCVLTTLQNVERSFELTRGVARSHDFPLDACFHMNPEFPKDVQLADNLYNTDGLVVVSPSLAAALDERHLTDVELLTVTIYNHKGRVASNDYKVVNPLQVVDCIDPATPNLVWNSIDPDLIASCFGLRLVGNRIDPGLGLFRLRHLPHVVVVREDIVNILEDRAFTGLRFVDLDEFEF